MHPKAMYKAVKNEIIEKLANDFDEEWEMSKSGWYRHPQEARLAGFVEDEDPEEKRIDDMSKDELEEHARQFGIELDKRKTKANMLKDFEDMIK